MYDPNKEGRILGLIVKEEAHRAKEREGYKYVLKPKRPYPEKELKIDIDVVCLTCGKRFDNPANAQSRASFHARQKGHTVEGRVLRVFRFEGELK